MSKPENHDIKRILSHWGLTAHKWEKIKDVYKVKTNQGVKNLKVSPLNLQRLNFVHHAINHLVQQGFQKMVPLIPTMAGTTYICHSGKAFSLFDWIEGNQSDFSNLNELKTAGRILAEFHRRSSGFTPPEGSNMRNQIGKCLEHFEHRYNQLLEYSEIARHSPDDPFAQLYLANAPCYLPMAERAILKLKNSNYQQLVYLSHSQRGFCHGDPAARNFITTPRNQMFMIDFDSCRLDLAIGDLIKFTRRVMKKYNWSYPIAKFLIDAYQEVNPLNPNELEVMKAVFYFPQKFWRLANRHFERHNRYTPEREVAKFKNYLTHKQQLTQFESDFDYYQ